MPALIKLCTSCGSADIEVAGNKYLCRICNVVYEVTDTGTKVFDAHPLDKITKRIDALEAKQKVKTEPTDPVEEQIDDETAPLNELPSDEEIDADIEANSEEDGFLIFE